MDRRAFLVGAAGLVAAPDALARANGGTPVALVTADTESRIVAVHLVTGKVVRSIPTLAGPRSIESVLGNDAVVAHTAHGAVSVVDGAGLGVRRVLRGFGEPRYAAASPLGRYVYVTDSARGEIATIDVRRGRIVSRTAVGGAARHLSLSRDGGRLWVALGTKAREVAVLDARRAARPRLLTRFRPPFLAHDVGFTPGGRRVWVTSGDRGEIAIYDARTARVVRTLAADAPPQHVTFSGKVALVTSGDDAVLRAHALDGRLLTTTSVPVGSYNVQEGFGLVMTPSLARGTLCILDTRGKLRRHVRVAASSHDASFFISM